MVRWLRDTLVMRRGALVFLIGIVLVTVSRGAAQQIFRGPEPPHAVSIGPPDTTTNAVRSPGLLSPISISSSINSSWAGMFQTSSIRPPDPHGAAGPSGIIQTVNLRVAYWPKTGGAATWGPVDLTGSTGFFGSVGNVSGNINSDPRTLYDVYSNRFYVVMLEVSSTTSFLNLAVSKSSNPTTSDASSWYFYRIDDTETVGPTSYGTDYPGLGIDSLAVYVTYNMYSLPFTSPNSSFNNCVIIVLNKNAINSGTATYAFVYTPSGSGNGFTLQPATVSGTVKPGNKAYFGEISFASNTAVRVWALADPLGARTLTSASVTVPNHGGYIDNAPQSGTTTTVATLSPRTQGNAFWWNGELWFCHTAGGGSATSKVYYYRIATNNYPTSAPTLVESGLIDGGTGVWTYQPSIGGNSSGNVCIVYTESSSSEFPTMKYTTRSAGAGSFESPAVVKVSAAYSNSDRWGDYASVTQDPSDGSFWITHEWSRSTSLHDWGTWWANVTPAPLPVQLVSLAASRVNATDVLLEWSTVSETNNYGFEVERSNSVQTNYSDVPNSFVAGHRTTLVPQSYKFLDSPGAGDQWIYRLKQIDLDGSVHYSNGVTISPGTFSAKNPVPEQIALDQNYPNPFNPTTTIKYRLPEAGWVTLSVYDPLGRGVATIVNEPKPAGEFEATFNAEGLASGMYFYRISVAPLAQKGLTGDPLASSLSQHGTVSAAKNSAGGFVATKRLLVLK